MTDISLGSEWSNSAGQRRRRLWEKLSSQKRLNRLPLYLATHNRFSGGLLNQSAMGGLGGGIIAQGAQARPSHLHWPLHTHHHRHHRHHHQQHHHEILLGSLDHIDCQSNAHHHNHDHPNHNNCNVNRKDCHSSAPPATFLGTLGASPSPRTPWSHRLALQLVQIWKWSATW